MWTTEEEMKVMLEACLVKMEANPEEIKSVAEHQEVPNEEVAVEMIGALKNRSGNRHLAVRHRGRLTRRCRSCTAQGLQ
jgi:hypothetical protein